MAFLNSVVLLSLLLKRPSKEATGASFADRSYPSDLGLVGTQQNVCLQPTASKTPHTTITHTLHDAQRQRNHVGPCTLHAPTPAEEHR